MAAKTTFKSATGVLGISALALLGLTACEEETADEPVDDTGVEVEENGAEDDGADEADDTDDAGLDEDNGDDLGTDDEADDDLGTDDEAGDDDMTGDDEVTDEDEEDNGEL